MSGMKNEHKVINGILAIIHTIDNGLIGFIGPAGVGKTTLTSKISKTLKIMFILWIIDL